MNYLSEYLCTTSELLSEHLTHLFINSFAIRSKNYDGTIDETGTVVKGAVDKFAAEVCRQITISYREAGWNTWAIRK